MEAKSARTISITYPNGASVPVYMDESEYSKFKEFKNQLGNSYKAYEKLKEASINQKAIAYNANTPIEKELIRVIDAYEDLLMTKNKRRTSASRTWQMVKRHGLIGAAERAVNRESDAEGYKILVDRGLSHLTFEAVIVDNPTYFKKEAVDKAKERLTSLNS